jgi:hypothetical protein
MKREDKAANAAKVREAKYHQWRELKDFIYPRIVAALGPQADGDWLLPSKWDIKMTSRELRETFGVIGRDIVERLFIRWQTKAITQHGPRAPRWRLNHLAVFEFNDWLMDKKPTPREVLDYLKSQDFERLRLIRYFENGKLEERVMTVEEHNALLDTSLRQQRKEWAQRRYRFNSNEEREKISAIEH